MECLVFVFQVSAWGGYVFIINLIPLHVFVLLLMQRYSKRVYIGKTHTHSADAKLPYLPPLRPENKRFDPRKPPQAPCYIYDLLLEKLPHVAESEGEGTRIFL